MTKEGVETLLALGPDRGPVSEVEADELAEFFCGKEEEDGTGDGIDKQDIESP